MARPINTTTRIGLLRSTLGLNAQDFAALAGISVGALRKIEAGFDTLSTRTTERLAYASGVDPDWLLGAGEDNLPLRLDLATGELVPLTREDFEFRPYTRLKQLQYLIRTGQIDSDFFWNNGF